jgi:hypothetical protein
MSGPYCNLSDLQSLTGISTNRISANDMNVIITQASREIDAYLTPYDYAATNDGATISAACLKLAAAGCAERGWLDGSHPTSLTVGNFKGQFDPDKASAMLRADAWELLRQFVESQIVRVNIHTKRVYTV